MLYTYSEKKVPVSGFVVLFVFKSVRSTALHIQLNDPKTILTFYCTVRCCIFYFQFDPPAYCLGYAAQ